MIHSLSGGVIKSGGTHRIVRVGGRWFLSDEFAVAVGDKVFVESDGKIVKDTASEVKIVAEAETTVRIKSLSSVINVAFE